eukprot:EG_transcript_6744
MHYCVSFNGCGWLYIYHLGVAKYLQTHYALDSLHFAGTSAGALVAACLVAGIPIGPIVESNITTRGTHGDNPFTMLDLLDWGIERWTPYNAAAIAGGRLCIALTAVKGFAVEPKYIQRFKDRAHLVAALRGSCHLPILGGLLPYKVDGQQVFDGFFVDNHPLCCGLSRPGSRPPPDPPSPQDDTIAPETAPWYSDLAQSMRGWLAEMRASTPPPPLTLGAEAAAVAAATLSAAVLAEVRDGSAPGTELATENEPSANALSAAAQAPPWLRDLARAVSSWVEELKAGPRLGAAPPGEQASALAAAALAAVAAVRINEAARRVRRPGGDATHPRLEESASVLAGDRPWMKDMLRSVSGWLETRPEQWRLEAGGARPPALEASAIAASALAAAAAASMASTLSLPPLAHDGSGFSEQRAGDSDGGRGVVLRVSATTRCPCGCYTNGTAAVKPTVPFPFQWSVLPPSTDTLWLIYRLGYWNAATQLKDSALSCFALDHPETPDMGPGMEEVEAREVLWAGCIPISNCPFHSSHLIKSSS